MLFPSWISLRFFNTRYRSLAMFQVAQRQAGNLAAARCLLSVLKPEVFRPLRSARFLNRPHDLKFNGTLFSSLLLPMRRGRLGGGFKGKHCSGQSKLLLLNLSLIPHPNPPLRRGGSIAAIGVAPPPVIFIYSSKPNAYYSHSLY